MALLGSLGSSSYAKIKVASFEDPKRLSQFPSQWGEHLPHVMGRVLSVVDEDNKSGVIGNSACQLSLSCTIRADLLAHSLQHTIF